MVSSLDLGMLDETLQHFYGFFFYKGYVVDVSLFAEIDLEKENVNERMVIK